MVMPPFAVLDHVGIAAAAVEPALASLTDMTGSRSMEPETVASQSVTVVMLPGPSCALELIVPDGPETPITRFLASRGGGLHHLAFRVPDIEAAIAWCRERQVPLLSSTWRLGAHGRKVIFVAPSAFAGVLTELCEGPLHVSD